MKTKKILAFLLLTLALPSVSLAVAIAPEDLPSQIDQETLAGESSIEQDDGTEEIADKLFPEVDVPDAVVVEEEDGVGFTQTALGIVARAGDTVLTTEAIGGDAFFAANEIVIANPVNGDVFSAGRRILIDADVNDSLRLAGNDVEIRGDVAGNALIFANSVHITDAATIHGHVNIYANAITIDGTIGGNVKLAGNAITISGTLMNTGDIEGSKIRFKPTAELQQQVYVRTDGQVAIHEDVAGEDFISVDTVNAGELQKTITERQRMQDFNGFLRSYFFFLVVGTMLILLIPQWTERVTHTMLIDRPKDSWRSGALFFLLFPLALILLTLTLVGIPFAFLGSVFYVFALAVGRLFAGMVLGLYLVNHQRFTHNKRKQLITFAVGYFILSVLMHMAFIGWLVVILASIWGIGGVIQSRKQKKSSTAVTKATSKPKATKKRTTKRKVKKVPTE